jgi:tetratricopeptide (TPR) repeat protein
LSSKTDIPEPDKKMIDKWTKEIITSNKLTELDTVQKVSESIARYLEQKFKEYSISISSKLSENGFIIKVKDSSLEEPSNWFSDLLEDEKLSNEELKIKKIAKEIYLHSLAMLELIDPAKYQEYLQTLNLKSYTAPPHHQVDLFAVWADKIVSLFKLSNDTPLNKIINKTIIFFDMLFPDYAIEYSKQKDDYRYPVFIDRLSDNYLMWLSVIDKIKRQIFCTHHLILQKLNRTNDFPQYSDFWLELVLVYEEMGLTKEANEFGRLGLTYDSPDMGLLTELTTYYAQKRRFTDGLKYIKKTGEIFYEQKEYSIALRIFQQIVSFEPNGKSNWINLEKAYLAMGNKKEAEKCREKYSKLG